MSNKNDSGGFKLTNIQDFTNKEFTKSNNFLNSFSEELNLRETKLINALCYAFSTYSKITKTDEIKKNVFYNTFEKEGFFEFNYQQLLKIMDCEKTRITINQLEENLDNITKTYFKYIKFEGERPVKVGTHFINTYEIRKRKDFFDNEVQKETTIRLYLNKNLYKDIFEFTKIGYTTLNINMNKLKSKMAIGLYEELKKITPLKQIRRKKDNVNYSITNKFKQIHSYTLEEMNSICSSKYKFLSQLKDNIIIQYINLVDKKYVDDIYKFHIENKKIVIEIVRMKFFDDIDEF